MDMLNGLRAIVTVVAFVTFLAIILWAWSSRRKDTFSQAARIPMEDDDLPRYPKAEHTAPVSVERTRK